MYNRTTIMSFGSFFPFYMPANMPDLDLKSKLLLLAGIAVLGIIVMSVVCCIDEEHSSDRDIEAGSYRSVNPQPVDPQPVPLYSTYTDECE